MAQTFAVSRLVRGIDSHNHRCKLSWLFGIAACDEQRAQILDTKKDLDNEADEDENEATAGADDDLTGMSAVVKTTQRQTVFLPVIGLVPHEELTPGDLVGTNRDSYLVLEKLPPECVVIP